MVSCCSSVVHKTVVKIKQKKLLLNLKMFFQCLINWEHVFNWIVWWLVSKCCILFCVLLFIYSTSASYCGKYQGATLFSLYVLHTMHTNHWFYVHISVERRQHCIGFVDDVHDVLKQLQVNPCGRVMAIWLRRWTSGLGLLWYALCALWLME